MKALGQCDKEPSEPEPAENWEAIPGETCGVNGNMHNAPTFPWQAKFSTCGFPYDPYNGPTGDKTDTICRECNAVMVSPRWFISDMNCIMDNRYEARPGLYSKITFDEYMYGENEFKEYHVDFFYTQMGSERFSEGAVVMIRTLEEVKVQHAFPACLPKMSDCYTEESEAWFSSFTKKGPKFAGPFYMHTKETEGNSFPRYIGLTLPDNFMSCGDKCCTHEEFNGFGAAVSVRKDGVWYAYGISNGLQFCEEKTGGASRLTRIVGWILEQAGDELKADYALDCLVEDSEDYVMNQYEGYWADWMNNTNKCFCNEAKAKVTTDFIADSPDETTENFLITQLPLYFALYVIIFDAKLKDYFGK